MNDYISRDMAIARLTKLEVTDRMATMTDAKREIANLPVAHVAPVVYSRWAHIGGDEWCCTACGFVITTEGSWDRPVKKYCPNCGAKMDGGSDNG